MTLIECAHEAYEISSAKKECLYCGSTDGIEMHHWQGRGKGKRLGTANDILIAGIIPLCKKCHALDLRGEEHVSRISEASDEVAHRLKMLSVVAMLQTWLYENRNGWKE